MVKIQSQPWSTINILGVAKGLTGRSVVSTQDPSTPGESDCMTWARRSDQYRLLRMTYHRLLLRVIGYRRKRGTNRQLSYARALKKVGCKSVEALFGSSAGCLRGPSRGSRAGGGRSSGPGMPGAKLADVPEGRSEAARGHARLHGSSAAEILRDEKGNHELKGYERITGPEIA